MYHIITDDCPEGYAYVSDYQGNKVFYGTVAACLAVVIDLEGQPMPEVCNED